MSSNRDAEREIDGQAAQAAAEELAGYSATEQATDFVFDLDGEDVEDYCQELVNSGEILEAAVSGCTDLEDKIPPSLFDGRKYRQPLLVRNVHNLPRFGASRDISVISSGSDQEKADYERGVKASAVFIWAFFGIWVVALGFCRCTRRLGWLSGSPPKRPGTISEKKNVDPDSSDEDKEEVTEEAEPQPQHAKGQESKVSAPGSVNDSALEKPSNDDVYAEKEATPTTEPETEKAVNEPNEEEQEIKYQAKLVKFQRTLTRARIVTCISVACMCLFSVLLIARGFKSMTDVMKSAQVDISNILALTEPAQTATGQYAVGANDTINSRIEVIETLIECDFDLSNLEAIGFDSRFGNVRLNLTDKIAVDINITEALYLLNETLNNVTTFADIMISMDDSLADLNNNLSSMDVLLNDVSTWWYIPVSLFVVIMDVMAISFMVSVVLAWRGKQPRLLRKVNRWCVLPIFSLLLFVSVMISTICLIVSEVLSDFCIGDPANQVEAIVGATFPFDGYVKWYIRACNDEDRPTILLRMFPAVAASFRALETGLAALAAFVEQQGEKAPQICNGNVDLLQKSLSQLSEQYSALLNLAGEAYSLLQCPNINELYSHVTHETACNHAAQATTEIFAYLFLVAVCAMVLITVRVAWHAVPEVGDDLAVAEDGAVEEKAMEAPPADARADFAEKLDVDETQGDDRSEEILVIQQ